MKILLMMLLLICLIACSPSNGTVIKTEVVKCNVPNLPKSIEYYPVTWNLVDGKYCFTEDNGKALAQNIKFLRSREGELEDILKGLSKTSETRPE